MTSGKLKSKFKFMVLKKCKYFSTLEFTFNMTFPTEGKVIQYKVE